MECPARVPLLEIEFDVKDYPLIVMGEIDDVFLNPDVQSWMSYNIPQSRVETVYNDAIIIRFDSPKSAALFKIFWQ